MTQNRLFIFDTTLRDGMQGTGINYSLKDKLDIARRLDELGVDYIEGGFPLSNEKEEAFFQQMKKNPLHNAKLAAFGSTRKPGKKAQDDPHIQALLAAETPVVVVVGKSWLAHVEAVLETTPEENLRMIHDSIATLKAHGREVIFDLEHFFDGWKTDSGYCLKVLKTAQDAGADWLVPCDTNGGTLVSEATVIYAELARENFRLGAHFHNDLGLGVANSLAAVENGALQVQGTVNGWGERCGNANLCTIVPNLVLKMNHSTGMDLSRLTELSRFVAEKANLIPDRRAPFVGEAAFGHKAGQHADVLQKGEAGGQTSKDKKTLGLMEHMDPALVGNTRRILVSELAGKSTVALKLAKFGVFDKNSHEVQELTRLLKEKENQGYEYEAAEASFELLMLKVLGRHRPLFELDNYHLESFKTWNREPQTVGRVFVIVDGKRYMGAGVGMGPVGVLDKALRNALDHVYPFLRKLTLCDFAVRVLTSDDVSTDSKVRVFVSTSDGESNWDTVGVSENIVEASWEALVESFEYYRASKNL
ncbi:MAG: citramalate synthase [Spirochaetales bacterium]|nr:citramalate synthase [Spirochaetales bacterium]